MSEANNNDPHAPEWSKNDVVRPDIIDNNGSSQPDNDIYSQPAAKQSGHNGTVPVNPVKSNESANSEVIINDGSIRPVSTELIPPADEQSSINRQQETGIINTEPPLRRSNRKRTPAWKLGQNDELSGLDNQSSIENTINGGILRPQSQDANIGTQLPSRDVDTHDQEYVVERIISHGINEDPEHPTARVGETTYRVRWYGYEEKDDTYEPVRNLPRNKIVSYHKRKKLRIPENIDSAIAG